MQPMHESKKKKKKKKTQAESQKISLRSQNGGYLCGECYWQEKDTMEFYEVMKTFCILL